MLRRSTIPLYHQLARILREEIIAGSILPGELIPTEKTLMDQYSLSRNTVRMAVDLLVDEGLVHRNHGRGCFVVEGGLRIKNNLGVFVSNSEMLRREGYDVAVKVLSIDKISPDLTVRNALGLSEGEKVFNLSKVILADQRPAILDIDNIPISGIEKDFTNVESGKPFFDYIEKVLGEPVEFLVSNIHAICADKKIAGYLDVKEGTPLVLLKELFLDPTKRKPLAYGENYFNPEIVQFSILRRRD